MRAWVNGQLLPDPSAPAVAIDDHGLTVGDGVFEAIKVVDGVPFALTRHLRRLARSADGLGLPPVDDAAVRRGVAAVLEEPMSLGRVRITYTAGRAPLGSPRVGGEPTLVVAASSMDPAPETTTVVTVPWPRNERGALAGLKTTSYGENVRALAYAEERGATEAVFPNLAGQPLRGHGHQRLLRRRRGAAHPHARERLPRGGHPGARHRLVRRGRGRRADRGRRAGQRGVPRLDHPRRPGRLPLGRPGAAGAGPGDGQGADHVGRARGRARRSVTL